MQIDLGTLLVYIMSYFGLFTALFFLLTLYENKNGIKTPKTKNYPSVTIVVPAYNEEKTLSRAVNSLLKLDYPKEKLDIIIVDDGSTDNTYKIAKKYEKFGIRVFTKKNEGKAETLNFALKKAKGELFGVLDADSWVSRDALKKLVAYFDDQKLIAVTPSMKIGKPKTVLQKIQAIEFLFGIFLRKIFSFLGSIHVTPGPFSIFRKSFFDKTGGYKTNTLTEDIEIALRIQDKGYKIENSVDACVFTKGPAVFKALLRQRIRWYKGFLDNIFAYKHLIFSSKHGNLGMFILPASLFSVGLAIVMLLYTISKFLVDWLKRLRLWYSVDFDLKKMLAPNLDLFYFNIDTITYLSIFILSLGLIMIYLSKKMSKEKSNIKLSYVYYTLVYMPLFAFWWLIAIYYKVTKKKIKWGPKHI